MGATVSALVTHVQHASGTQVAIEVTTALCVVSAVIDEVWNKFSRNKRGR